MSESIVERIVGYPVYRAGAQECVGAIVDWAVHGDRARWLACLNPHSYAVAARTPEFAAALQDADWLIPDGIGVVLASRLLGGRVRERVTGSDIFFGVNGALNGRGGARLFFIGSTETTLARIREKIAADYPLLEVAGTYSPPFKERYASDDLDHMLAAINAVKADIVWVGMTAPKQELWIHSVRHRLDVRFLAGVGAVFDFYAGRIKRPPPVVEKMGLEWLSRLVQEPRRLWRRTLVSAPVFVSHVVRERMRMGSIHDRERPLHAKKKAK